MENLVNPERKGDASLICWHGRERAAPRFSLLCLPGECRVPDPRDKAITTSRVTPPSLGPGVRRDDNV